MGNAGHACQPRSHREGTKYDRSAAGSALSGDQGPESARLWLGYRYSPVHDARQVFPIGSFGHAGFTGTSLWIDPRSDTYVVVLANSIHVRGSPPMSNLRGEVATATARALRLYS
jgi:CubicO group peptidase (beta-lactamase class C family)